MDNYGSDSESESDDAPPECVMDCPGAEELASESESETSMFRMCSALREWQGAPCLDDCNATETASVEEQLGYCAPGTIEGFRVKGPITQL